MRCASRCLLTATIVCVLASTTAAKIYRLTILYFDCFSGASGDMILGALLDAGVVTLDGLRGALGSLAIAPDTVWTERVNRAGISCTKFCVVGEHPHEQLPDSHGHEVSRPQSHDVGAGHGHSHHVHTHHDHGHAGHAHGIERADHHPHRSLAEIAGLIDQSALGATGKARAKALFDRLGSVEADIHGSSMEKVHLHEVGALDSIIDIVGAVFALESSGIDQFVASPLNVGGGTVRSAHGVYPVPAPATVRLLEGIPVYGGPPQMELVTPTGALLLSNYVKSYGEIPRMRVRRVGYGAGSREFRDRPNVLRVLVGEADAVGPSHAIVEIQAEIDDMNPQLFGVVMDRLLADHALDVFYTPIQMKKNRPGTLLTVIAAPEARERLTSIIFRETTTIGVRYREMRRECLDRETMSVATPFGQVRMKVARRDGAVLNASPEFEDCARVATAAGRPVKEIQAAAIKAFLDATTPLA